MTDLQSETSGRLNEKFSEIMEKLYEIMLKKGEPFRAKAYKKAQETIITFPNNIYKPEDLKGLPGIGDTIMEKLKEYVSTGTLQIIETEKNNPINIIGEVYGIGPKKAAELVENDITTIELLREKQNEVLNETQKVGLLYYEDILKRILRSEIDQYSDIFEKEFAKYKGSSNDSAFEIVGSYRRGAESSGDIDVIVTSNNPNVFVEFIDTLYHEGIIVEVLSAGPSKCLVISRIPSSNTARRLDFLFTSTNEYPFALLYFTGSKFFNTVMRQRALSMKLTMNEHGLYKMDGKKKGEKIDHIFKNEKDIFDYLQLEYKAPNERIDGRSVIVKSNIDDKPNGRKQKQSNKTLKKKDSKKTDKTKTKKNNDTVELPVLDTSKDASKEDTVSKDSIIMQHIDDFKKNGIQTLHKLTELVLISMMTTANALYYNDTPILSDNEFDILQEFIKEKYPSNQVVNEIGAPVERNKVVLPYQMASMDKIKPDTNALTNWCNKYKGPYVISCKLDGVSGMFTTEGKDPKLYTRGDGKVGQDVSHFIPYLRLPKTKGLVIRGEFIIPKQVFETKYKDTFANPRNLVAGIINQKGIDEKIKDVAFVAYEVIRPVLAPWKQMEALEKSNVEYVLYRKEATLTNELLSSILLEWRKNYAYEIDGIIVTDDKIYERKAGNPEHAFAFKMVISDQIAEAKVVDVIWTASKDGYLKPRVQITPIHLGGVKIEYATGFNGAFIRDNSIGIGATVELIRSGDVIPHIRKVIVPASQPKMPDVPYDWNATNVDIVLQDIDTDETVKEKNITGFFRGIGVHGLSSGNIRRIIQSGYDSVPKIIHMTMNDFLQVDGFKTAMATKIYNGIREKIKEASIVTLMAASNIFGRGFSEKKLELIMNSFPEILMTDGNGNGNGNLTKEQRIQKVASIKGMAIKTSEAFVEKIQDFNQFMKDAGLIEKIYPVTSPEKNTVAEVDETNELYGKTIVMSCFRDDKMEAYLKKKGAKISSSVSKKTFLVIVKNKEDETGKTMDAKKLGIPLLSREEFVTKYS